LILFITLTLYQLQSTPRLPINVPDCTNDLHKVSFVIVIVVLLSLDVNKTSKSDLLTYSINLHEYSMMFMNIHYYERFGHRSSFFINNVLHRTRSSDRLSIVLTGTMEQWNNGRAVTAQLNENSVRSPGHVSRTHYSRNVVNKTACDRDRRSDRDTDRRTDGYTEVDKLSCIWRLCDRMCAGFDRPSLTCRSPSDFSMQKTKPISIAASPSRPQSWLVI